MLHLKVRSNLNITDINYIVLLSEGHSFKYGWLFYYGLFQSMEINRGEISAKAVLDSYHHILDVFQKERNAIYTRFGDGDVEIMMGNDQQNHKYSEGLSTELREAFSIIDDNYLKGLAVNYPVERGMSYGLFLPYAKNKVMEDYLKATFSLDSGYQFESAVFFHFLSVFNPAMINEFLNAVIRPKRKMYIGNIPQESVEKLIGKVDYYVETPFKNAYASIDSWWPSVEKNLSNVDMVIPAAGMASRVINKRIWNLNLDVQSFDIGSVVDAVDKRKSRKWIKLLGHRIDKILIPKMTLADRSNYIIKDTFFYLRKVFKKLKGE